MDRPSIALGSPLHPPQTYPPRGKHLSSGRLRSAEIWGPQSPPRGPGHPRGPPGGPPGGPPRVLPADTPGMTLMTNTEIWKEPSISCIVRSPSDRPLTKDRAFRAPARCRFSVYVLPGVAHHHNLPGRGVWWRVFRGWFGVVRGWFWKDLVKFLGGGLGPFEA